MSTARTMFTLLASALLMAGTARAQDTPTDQDVVRRAIHVCASCHGEEGRSKTPAIPSLAGQKREYLIAQLKDFRSQTRAEAGTRAYMWGISALLDTPAILGLSEYYAVQEPAPGHSGTPTLIAAGRKIYTDGIPDRGVRACASCHGDSAGGAAAFPRLAGQHATYLHAQLKLFGSKLRPHGVVMQVETSFLKPTEMRAVAEYLQSL
ncbi:MAG: c-type cytochrome [Rhizobacter sp.]